jgi:hypothetical protein
LQKHPDEELVDAIVEAFEADVALVVDFLQTEGRPIFTRPLSATQQYQYFMNPRTRQAMLQRILEREGPSGVQKYLAAMVRIAPRVDEERQRYLTLGGDEDED